MILLGKYCEMRVRRAEGGATATEYALMITGIAVALVAATVLMGGRLAAALDLAAQTLF